MAPVLGVRWIVGDGEADTIRALERSMRSVRAVLPDARIAVCVHTADVVAIRERVAEAIAPGAIWLQVDRDLPVFVRRRVDLSVADGLAWRFAPLRVFAEGLEVLLSTRFEVGRTAADILRRAAAPGQRRCVLVRDRAARRSPRAPGDCPILVRAVPASFDLEDALEAVLAEGPQLLRGDDAIAAEQAAVSRGAAPIALGVAPRRRAPRPVAAFH